MALSDQFFIIFLATIIIVRIFLFLKPISAPTIWDTRTHHYMYGIVGIVIGLIINSPVIYAIGAALFVDELTYLLIGGKTHKDNYSLRSLLGTALLVLLVFVFRQYLIFPFVS